ncbi:MAG TPA: aldo/keto reductase [Lachnospiraceae bacterium]|nr:aldo/keto reductase [Lachnospiraceae bacterium]
MNYRTVERDGSKLSILGFGCMRFPKKRGSIDLEETENEIMHAIEMGINYFDTAYVYPGSEETLGKILAKNQCREKVMIATKLPHYLIKKADSIENYFNEQLKRLQTDYIDYYLMHMLSDVGTWERLKSLGIIEWIEQKKASGQIKNIGFSYHGNTATFQELIDAYDWDFCQIQYNYMDEHSQAGRSGLMYAASKGMPVIIMEPLRGGRLVNDLPKKAYELFEKATPKRSSAEWALRWLWDQEQVSVILSGMNSMEMLDENIRIASDVQTNQLTKKDFQLYENVKDAINEKIKVPCTGCAYCMPCPRGVDIPGTFRCYNVSYTDKYTNGLREYIMCTSLRSNPSNASLCSKCGKCEKHCPQAIHIRDELTNAKKRFETPLYKIICGIARKFGRF